MLFYFLKTIKSDSLAYTCIWQELYFLNSFRANILIDNNLLGLKNMTINIVLKSAYIGDCKITILLNVRQKGPFVYKKLLI